MSRIVVFNSLTLDGVMQAPGRPDEDRRGGFAHGGWAAPYVDEGMGDGMAEGMADGGPLLLGRRMFAGQDAAELRLVNSVTTTTGVIIATYEPA
ncbi:hypothetical protein [Phytoactinopolyspora mesophila]|uniref:Dihydrofolate reductase n=1 Tax=Phytoactinopolyspora mesophila TaxID=2650750 RepID=A0A7K3M0M0_9ACTN|nr:hypothetical protein [Phytoactinopolyspora mesophila]NDL56577.1 hypothetical protein [Phytoactinopolyspora mesophila]